MKDFIKSVLATMVGIFGFFIVMGVLTMMSIIGMVASSSAAQNVEENSVFVLNLSGAISDQGTDNPLSLSQATTRRAPDSTTSSQQSRKPRLTTT